MTGRCYPTRREPKTTELEGSATSPSLAPPTKRRGSAPDRRRLGCPRRGRQLVDDACPRGGTGGPPTPPHLVRLGGWPTSSLPGCPHCWNAAPKPMASVGRSGPAAGSPRCCIARLEGAYHPGHGGRLCKAIRWSRQKPARRARQRDDAALAHWRDETWPTIKRGRKPSSKGASSETNRVFIPCLVSCAPMRR
jgi:Winged helix-turn helix